MRKHSILNVAFYGLVIVLSCLPRAWSVPHNRLNTTRLAKRAINVDPMTCVGTWGTSVNTALREALDIVNYAIPRLQALLNNMNSVPVPSIIGMNNADRTVFQTYEPSSARLIATAEKIQGALANPGSVNLEIYCGDNFMEDLDPAGLEHGNGVKHFDMRKWHSHGTGAIRDCALCLGHIIKWTARYSAGDTVTNWHDSLPVLTNSLQMDYRWGYLPATLIHELTHAVTVMKSPGDILGDQCLRNNLPAYQWQCIRQFAQENVDFAANNADTFSLFVTAIYFNNNDWSTRVGQNLGFIPLVPT
ncbi:hypothetical protein QBC43DRAFT_301553 [Cladorrhinum sp. PSN259]|nr:hypothetical protein QBC43DRAFT_301553 [Cladorrhinum sp. PSN259]